MKSDTQQQDGGAIASKDGLECDCKQWCDLSLRTRFLTGHHANCPKATITEFQGAMNLIRALVKGMENWAADEDGVHPDAWEAYKRGKAVIGEFNWKEDEHSNDPN
jgi:hypothetical protein